jgi:hypothetical protein
MGLDGIEIVMEVEDRFGITIRDAEAQRIRTVGDLTTLINSRMTAPAMVCPSLTAFLQVRGVTREFLLQSTLRLRPSTSITSVVPISRRREFWRKLSEMFGSAPPALRRPAPLRVLLLALSCGVMALGVGTASIDFAIVPLGVLVAIGIILALYLATSVCRVVPPASLTTFGDLSRRLAGLSRSSGPKFSADEIMAAVRSIVVDALGVAPEVVVMEARFVEDMDMA